LGYCKITGKWLGLADKLTLPCYTTYYSTSSLARMRQRIVKRVMKKTIIMAKTLDCATEGGEDISTCYKAGLNVSSQIFGSNSSCYATIIFTHSNIRIQINNLKKVKRGAGMLPVCLDKSNVT